MKHTEKGTLVLDGKFVALEMQNTIKKKIDDANVKELFKFYSIVYFNRGTEIQNILIGFVKSDY